MEPKWTFLGVVWTTWGPFLDAQAGHSKYLGSVLNRLSKRCGVEAGSGGEFSLFVDTMLGTKMMLKVSLDTRAKTKSLWVPI